MNINRNIGRSPGSFSRQRGLIPALLSIGLLACSLQPGRTAQAAGEPAQDDTQPASETAPRSERPVTPPPNLERAPGADPASPVTGEAPSELLEKVITDLASRKNAARREISVTRSESVIWPDGSLGCPQPGEMYTQAPVQGYWIVLRWSGKEFDYRASSRGSLRLCEKSFKVRPPVG